MDLIVELRISNKNYITANNHRLLSIIKKILYEGRNNIQIIFGILYLLYPIDEMNIVFSVDQETYRLDMQNAPSKIISLHIIANKVGTSNSIIITCL